MLAVDVLSSTMDMLTYTLIFSALTSVTLSDTFCPDDWTVFNGSCYLFAFDQTLTFVEAEHYCQQHNGYLVNINDVHENNFILNFVTHITPNAWWVGLTDRDIEGEWRWVGSNTAPTFTYWYPGQPESAHHSHNEDCTRMAGCCNYNFKWHDIDCGNQYQPLCEKKADSEEIFG